MQLLCDKCIILICYALSYLSWFIQLYTALPWLILSYLGQQVMCYLAQYCATLAHDIHP